MNNRELVKFINQAIELEIEVSLDKDTVWLSKEQMALLYKRDRSVISKHINKIYKDEVLDKESTCAKDAHVQIEGSRSVSRIIEYYNLDVILAVGYRIKSENGQLLKDWFYDYLSSKNRDIIVYNNGVVQLDVTVEPIKETVWLTVNQMAELFDTSKDNVYLHIKNIYDEGELIDSVTEESSATRKDMVQKASDGKSYLTSLYNLDVILAVGYRIKGKRAIEFRRWVSSVLKQYLLKGYAIDKNRTLVTNENYLNLINEVSTLKNDVKTIKDILSSKVRNSFVCYEGKYYEGFSFINSLICSSKERVIVVDGYADNSVFDYFIGSKKGIKKVILCHKTDRIERTILERFIKQYGDTIIKEDKSYHDRFLIIDNDIYLLGASLNSIGNKTSTITKTDEFRIEDIYKDE